MSKTKTAEDDWPELDATTFRPRLENKTSADSEVPGFTVIWHPDPQRVGETAMLTDSLSRQDPYFAQPAGDGGRPRPLLSPCLSRQPLKLRIDAKRVVIDPAGSPTRLVIDGLEITAPVNIERPRLDSGVPLLLGDRIVLLLHLLPAPVAARPPRYNLVGESSVMLDLRRYIRQVACSDRPVLLRGETGTGKELVARAIHENGSRSRRELIAVNAGAIPTELAEAELFGAAKGAYSGADKKRLGFFQEAHEGTLFLDEIGDIAAAIQVKLLRALEAHEIQPLGAAKIVKVDVRMISATDSNLEENPRFDDALRFRLGTQIEVPSLRARRDDIGRLFRYFLHAELEKAGEAWRLDLDDPRDESWVPADLLVLLVNYSWPGNVRELRNVVRDLAIFSRGETRMTVTDQIRRRLTAATPVVPPIEPHDEPKGFRHPDTISKDELITALREHRWIKKRAADALGASETSVDSLMKKFGIRRPADLSRKKIEDTLERFDGDVDAAAQTLEVSKHGLRQRMRTLGIAKKKRK